jgi:hypothetical protein
MGAALVRLAGMQIAIQLVVLVHLVGFAALFGGLIAQVRAIDPEVTGVMVVGAVTELVTGAALLILSLVADQPLNWGQIAVKLVITLFVALLVLRNRRFLSIPRGLWTLLTGLTFVNAALAVLWA